MNARTMKHPRTAAGRLTIETSGALQKRKCEEKPRKRFSGSARRQTTKQRLCCWQNSRWWGTKISTISRSCSPRHRKRSSRAPVFYMSACPRSRSRVITPQQGKREAWKRVWWEDFRKNKLETEELTVTLFLFFLKRKQIWPTRVWRHHGIMEKARALKPKSLLNSGFATY